MHTLDLTSSGQSITQVLAMWAGCGVWIQILTCLHDNHTGNMIITHTCIYNSLIMNIHKNGYITLTTTYIKRKKNRKKRKYDYAIIFYLYQQHSLHYESNFNITAMTINVPKYEYNDIRIHWINNTNSYIKTISINNVSKWQKFPSCILRKE